MPKKTVEIIVDSENDYLLVVKNNQKNLYQAVKESFLEKENVENVENVENEKKKEEIKEEVKEEKIEYYCEEREENKGKVEIRKCTVKSYESEEWRGLKTIVKIEKEIKKKEGRTRKGGRKKYRKENKKEERVQYLISSRGITEEYDARYFLGVKRRHWGIEVFHYVKDVVLKEDENKTEVAMIDGLINSVIYNVLKEEWTKKMRKYKNKPLKFAKEHELITIMHTSNKKTN